MNIPEDLKYTKDHEWVRIDSDGVAEIGITEYAQGELGDIIYVGIEYSIDGDVAKGEEIGTIEAVKTVAQIYSPVTGKIQDINIDVNDSPNDINTDPYGKGWLVKITPTKPEDLNELMDANAYKALIGS
ncbi:MAG TPA: glycine cleavage system protein GcvH [Ignavibacteria bacterium]|nr:glycine cleavage system protein GcvH [Ignavibacteria bacterium]